MAAHKAPEDNSPVIKRPDGDGLEDTDPEVIELERKGPACKELVVGARASGARASDAREGKVVRWGAYKVSSVAAAYVPLVTTSGVCFLPTTSRNAKLAEFVAPHMVQLAKQSRWTPGDVARLAACNELMDPHRIAIVDANADVQTDDGGETHYWPLISSGIFEHMVRPVCGEPAFSIVRVTQPNSVPNIHMVRSADDALCRPSRTLEDGTVVDSRRAALSAEQVECFLRFSKLAAHATFQVSDFETIRFLVDTSDTDSRLTRHSTLAQAPATCT